MKAATYFYWAKLLSICVVVVAFTVVFVDMHESAHSQIYKGFGCKNVSIEFRYGGLLGGSTWCEEWVQGADQLEAWRFHSINEIFGYHLAAICFLVVCLYFHYVMMVRRD